MIRRIFLFSAAAALATLTGCTSFDELDFTFRSPPADKEVIVSFDQIVIREGTAVGVIARPLDRGEEMHPDTEVVLESKNPGVLGVGPGAPNANEEGRDDTENWLFVIYGVSAGETEVAVRIDGRLEAHIPASVLAQ